jgi:hypothetical protein
MATAICEGVRRDGGGLSWSDVKGQGKIQIHMKETKAYRAIMAQTLKVTTVSY